MSDHALEPWLRGEPPTVHPLVQPVVDCLRQAQEDLHRLTDGLSADQIWAAPHGIVAIGFQLRLIAGSISRLASYARGEELSAEQFSALESEKTPGAGREELLRAVGSECSHFETLLKTVAPSTFTESRTVGRKRLPTTLIGLFIHTAEHTQRHVGQALAAARVVRSEAKAD